MTCCRQPPFDRRHAKGLLTAPIEDHPVCKAFGGGFLAGAYLFPLGVTHRLFLAWLIWMEEVAALVAANLQVG